MAVTAKWFGPAFQKAFAKEISWTADTIKVMLTTSAYIPDQDNHAYKSSVTNEVVGTAYVARGKALTTKTSTYTGATNVVKLAADNVQWATSTITARIAVIYDDTGVDATSALIGYVDFGVDVISTGGNFDITWDANGILTVTPA